jgi:hypothetical protein
VQLRLERPIDGRACRRRRERRRGDRRCRCQWRYGWQQRWRHDGGDTAEIDTWLDDGAVKGLRVDATPTPDVDEGWLRSGGDFKPALADFRLGWEVYGGGDMNLWFDDVALAGRRVGCQ